MLALRAFSPVETGNSFFDTSRVTSKQRRNERWGQTEEDEPARNWISGSKFAARDASRPGGAYLGVASGDFTPLDARRLLLRAIGSRRWLLSRRSLRRLAGLASSGAQASSHRRCDREGGR